MQAKGIKKQKEVQGIIVVVFFTGKTIADLRLDSPVITTHVPDHNNNNDSSNNNSTTISPSSNSSSSSVYAKTTVLNANARVCVEVNAENFHKLLRERVLEK